MYNVLSDNHWKYPVFSFLRSLFIVPDWDRQAGSDVRRCRICGRREELDIYDGGSVNAWSLIWKGYPQAHFAMKHRKPAAQGAKSPVLGDALGHQVDGAAGSSAVAGALVRIGDPGDLP